MMKMKKVKVRTKRLMYIMRTTIMKMTKIPMKTIITWKEIAETNMKIWMIATMRMKTVETEDCKIYFEKNTFNL